MDKSRIIYYLTLIARAVVGTVFVLAAVGKIVGANEFLVEIHNYDMLPLFLERLGALFLPWLELCAGILLIFGHKLKASSAIISILLLVFTIGVAVAWGRGLEINCGCFGDAGGQEVGFAKIAENLLMLGGTVLIFLFGEDRTAKRIDSK